MSARFPRVDLSTSPDVQRELILFDLFYRGLNNKIVGPTGSGKTIIATRLVLEALRVGEVPAHLDMEIGQAGTKSTYAAHGATAQEVAGIHYVEFPEPRLEEARDLAQSILDEGETFVLFDKKPDFLRSMKLRENDNDDQSEFYGSLVDPLREKVTTVMLAPTGHAYGAESDAGKRGRGASESDYKYDAIWQLSVLDAFDRQRVGRVALKCTKDRWGYIGAGRVVEFEVGGDGQGGIAFRVLGSGFGAPAPGSAGASGSSPIDDYLAEQAVAAGRAIAPDASTALGPKDYLEWFDANLPPGKRGSKEQRLRAIQQAAHLDPDRDGLVEVDTGRSRGKNKVLHYHYRPAQEEA